MSKHRKQPTNGAKNKPNKRKNPTLDKQQQTSKKAKQDIIQLFQKRQKNFSVKEIVLSDDSSDFVIPGASKQAKASGSYGLTEKTNFPDEAAKSKCWLSAAEIVTKGARIQRNRSTEDNIQILENGSADDKSNELDSSTVSSSPELFNNGNDPVFETAAVKAGNTSSEKGNVETEEECEISVDPYALLLTSFSDTDNELKAVTDSTSLTDPVNHEFLSDLQPKSCRNTEKCFNTESASKEPKVVVLDGVKKQSTITSFFSGKGAKPVLTFVGDKRAQTKVTSVTNADDKLVNNEDAGKWESSSNRTCPFYKKIPGTKFAVDAFSYGAVPGVEKYFLSHFHSDHYQGLNKSFRKPIYCTEVTANLVALKLRVNRSYLKVLPLNQVTDVDGVEVIPLEANHCPGAAMLSFHFPQSGQRILHTGDFRFHRSMMDYQPLQFKINQLFLDTTYLNPSYNFPSQDEVIRFVREVVSREAKGNPRVLVVSGSYTIGKEKVFMAAAEVLDCQVCTSAEKHRVLNCLNDAELKKRLTVQPTQARVHVLPMMQIVHSRLRSYLDGHKTRFDRLIAFKPTGWTHSQGRTVTNITPSVQGPIHIYSVPYSEHSSFTELEQFLKFLRPDKVTPTVNVGSPTSRNKMNGHIQNWLKEVRR